MDGGNYIRGKRGISMIDEAFQYLQLSAFLESTDSSRYKLMFENSLEL